MAVTVQTGCTGDRREDFIAQHLGATWVGHNSALQAELEMFVQRARPIIQNSAYGATRLPQALEGPLTHLDKIIRASTSPKHKRRPWPYVAALMDAFPGYSRTKVTKTLNRLQKLAEAQEALRLTQDAKIAIQQHLKIRVCEHDAFVSASSSSPHGVGGMDARDSAQHNWLPKTQILLYVAVMRLKK